MCVGKSENAICVLNVTKYSAWFTEFDKTKEYIVVIKLRRRITLS